MATRAYVIPRRNDVSGMGIQFTDVFPNTSLKNSTYDGFGQTGYISFAYDQPAPTTVDGDAYCCGSLTTAPVGAVVDGDTTGGGDDVAATPAATFGLVGYILERVQPGGGASALANPATPAEALSMANAIAALVDSGVDITLAAIEAALSGVVADTTLTTSGSSLSFGSVEEVLQILQGQSYRTRANTIVGVNGGGAFLDLADRQTLVDAQDVAANGGITFYAQGGFLTRGEPGFRDILPLYVSETVRASAAEGVLAGLGRATQVVSNPAYSYASGSPKTRATTTGGTVIPATGVGSIVAVYLPDGTKISL